MRQRLALLFIIIGSFIVFGSVSYIVYWYVLENSTIEAGVVSPLGKKPDKRLLYYSIPNLQQRSPKPSIIRIEESIATTSSYTTSLFSYVTSGKRAGGLINIPKNATVMKKAPIIVQLRGYVNREQYSPGEGSRRSGQVLAENGYITIAPDFLGYGSSDMPSSDIFEERFETYTTVLDLISSISSLPEADTNRIGLWGHSNGGHIALVVLEALGLDIPTVLWAPVTKPFPYSIMYYTDELEDGGKYLRKELSMFESLYDAVEFSLTSYIDSLSAPIFIAQGALDEEVPLWWNQEFEEALRSKNKSVTLTLYPKTDHTMNGDWEKIMKDTVLFYSPFFK